MKLRKLSVSGWRCFARQIDLPDFGEGLNIVHGPNGIGKSSLLMALVRLFGDRFKSKAEPISQLRPWGTDLAPRALVEFEHGGDRWQLEKQFWHGAFAMLCRWDGRQWFPVAQNEAADERVRQMLQMESAGRSTLDPDKWGLAQVLWAKQGEMQLGALSTSARALIQESLGAHLVGSEGTAVEERVDEIYARNFTSQGKYRSGAQAPPLISLLNRLLEIQQRIADQRQKLQHFDAAVQKIEELRLKAEQARQEERRVSAEEVAAKQMAEAYAALVRDRDMAANEAKAAKAETEKLRLRLDEIAAARQEIGRWREQAEKLRTAEEAVKADADLKQVLLDQATAQLKQVRDGHDKIDAADRRMKRAERWLTACRQIDDGKKLLTHVEGLARERKLLQEKRELIAAPDPVQLANLRKVFRERDLARSRFENSLITVEIQTETAAQIEVTKGESATEQHVPADSTFVARGSPEVELRLKGIASIRARGPAGSVDVNRNLLTAAESQLEKLCSPWGTQDLAALEESSRQAGEFDQQIRDCTLKIDMLLGQRSLEEVQRECALAERQIEELRGEEPEWEKVPPVLSALRDQSSQLIAEFKSTVDRAEKQKDLSSKDANDAHIRLAGHQKDLQHAERQVTAQEKRLVQSTNDGLSDEARSDAYQSAAAQFAAAQGQLKAAEDKLSAAGVDPRSSARMLQERGSLLRKVSDEALKELHRAEGELQRLTEDCPYSALAEAEEQEAQLKEQIARLQLEMDAAKLLHDTLHEQRRQLVDSLVVPVRQRVAKVLKRIIGTKFGDLEIDQEFVATGIHPTSGEQVVALEQLSGGELEQVHFAVRLALAEIAFPDGKQLIVLDDVFTFTDQNRLKLVSEVLADFAQRFQIVLLTCHPERYAGFTSAKFFDLESLTGNVSAPLTIPTSVTPPPAAIPISKPAAAIPPSPSPPPPHKPPPAKKNQLTARTLPGFD